MNNSSYKEYLTEGLESLSKHFSVKTYKLAPQEEWTGFERGKDLRIQIRWKGDCIWEWVLEKTFWIQRNTNKEDRIYMRNHADIKLNTCKGAIIKKNPAENKTKLFLKEKNKVGNTQTLFDKMKKNDIN
tara:strand:+ start:25548 stop:25934 length:387 start_codon:yes stop_codon:yes gene_type:complete